MTQVLEIAGPLEIRYRPDRPLGLVLGGAIRDGAGRRLLAAADCATDPGLPSGLADVALELPRADGGELRLRQRERQWTVPVRRVLVYEDLGESMRGVVPPEPVTTLYRLRWGLGVLLARLPIPKSWLG